MGAGRREALQRFKVSGCQRPDPAKCHEKPHLHGQRSLATHWPQTQLGDPGNNEFTSVPREQAVNLEMGGFKSGLVAPARRRQNRAWADALGEVWPPRCASLFRRLPRKLARLETPPLGPDLLAAPRMLPALPQGNSGRNRSPFGDLLAFVFPGEMQYCPRGGKKPD